MMKHITIKILALSALMLTAYSCAEETFPNDSFMTEDQIDTSDPTIVAAFARSIVSKMATPATFATSSYYDLGYPSVNMIRDMGVSDFPINSPSYDYFPWFARDFYMGEYASAQFFWTYYYSLVMQCNNMLKLTYNENSAQYFAMAYFYRAFFYFDMARYFEFKKTGYAEKDNLATERGIYGLTCPIVSEKTTEDEAINMPRAKYADMYSFILKDILQAQKMIGEASSSAKYMPSGATVMALKARVYLELASHMEQRPEDLSDISLEQGYEALTAIDMYKMAEACADKAITMHEGHPLTRDEWYAGFNNMTSPSWLLGITIGKETISSSWLNFVSYMSMETSYGLSGILYTESSDTYFNSYKSQRCIGADLYAKIPDSDWRKKTWIDPEDAGDPEAVKNYDTKVPGAFFAELPAYGSFKYRPATIDSKGYAKDYSTGSAVDYPIMRIEEMYFVKFEAMAHTQSVAAASNALQDFVNDYRYTDGSYLCSATTMTGFIDEMIKQKRIEFWGEGIISHDYKRLNLRVYRYYPGTNFPEKYAFNSYDGYCAPWLTGYIRQTEVGRNPALIQNPDPSISEAQQLRD